MWIIASGRAMGDTRAAQDLAGTGPRTPEIGENGQLGLVDVEPLAEPPLDMKRTSKTPDKQPQSEQRHEDARHHDDGAAKLEQVRAGHDEGLDDNTEAAGHADRGAEGRDEHPDWVAAGAALMGVSFGVHGRP